MVAAAQVKLASVVLFVADLERSIAFYSELLTLTPTIREDGAALLVSADGCQIYLRSIGERGGHPLGTIGPQYVLWSAETKEEFDRCEAVLRGKGGRVSVIQHDGFLLLEGRDPDDEPVVVTFPGPDRVPRREIISRIYGW